MTADEIIKELGITGQAYASAVGIGPVSMSRKRVIERSSGDRSREVNTLRRVVVELHRQHPEAVRAAMGLDDA